MKKHTIKEEKVKSKIPSILIVFFFLFSACVPAETSSPTAAEEKPVETEAVAEVLPEKDECVSCHTNKQHLIDTAKPVVEEESESSGVG